MPWWAAVLVGFGLAGLGAIIDIQSQDNLGLLFKACYFVGAVGAIAIVRRRNVFAPMVQPPLIIGVIVPVVVLLASGLPEGSDTLATALAIGMPLIKGFPTMAITTVLVVAIGVFRIYRERDPNQPVKYGGEGGFKGAVARVFGKNAAGKPRRDASPARRESGAGRKSAPARERQAPQRGQEERRRPPEGRSKSDPRTPGGKTPPPGRERGKGGKGGKGGKPPQERQGSAARKPPEGGTQRGRRPPEQQDRSGKQPPPKSSQPRKSAQPPSSPSPQDQRKRREQDSQPRRQPPKRPWD